MYSMVVNTDEGEIVILRDVTVLYVLRRDDWAYAAELFANLNGEGGEV